MHRSLRWLGPGSAGIIHRPGAVASACTINYPLSVKAPIFDREKRWGVFTFYTGCDAHNGQMVIYDVLYRFSPLWNFDCVSLRGSQVKWRWKIQSYCASWSGHLSQLERLSYDYPHSSGISKVAHQKRRDGLFSADGWQSLNDEHVAFVRSGWWCARSLCISYIAARGNETVFLSFIIGSHHD